MGNRIKRKRIKITEKTKISELIKYNSKIAEVLYRLGMDCVGCRGVITEDLKKACINHGKTTAEVIREINKLLKE